MTNIKTPVLTYEFFVKPQATAACTFAIDQFVFSKSNFNTSLILGVESGGGAYLGMMVGSSIPDLKSFFTCFLENGKRVNRKSG